MKRFILGSQSPRRREILSHFDLPFKAVSPDFDEESIPFSGDPGEFACLLSKGKAESLAMDFYDTPLLTADTIVYQDGRCYGKPQDQDTAFTTLSALSGKWHSVFTGVTLRLGDKQFHQSEETKVLFNDLTPFQIEQYIKTQAWSDKAGGYGLQGDGGLLVRRIDGCFYNVIGLPLNTVYALFKKIDIDLWEHMK